MAMLPNMFGLHAQLPGTSKQQDQQGAGITWDYVSYFIIAVSSTSLRIMSATSS